MSALSELKQKQRATWALGDYDRIADGLTVSTDQTLRVARVRPGERVLDLATGTGITAIAARERGASVTAVDLTPQLLEVARRKAELRQAVRDNSWGLSDRVLLERMQASDEACTVNVALCEKPYELPARRFGVRKNPLFAGF